MDLTVTRNWKSHQLATTEMMQREIARFTHPVLFTVAIVSLAYLALWALVYCFWETGFLPGLFPLAAAGTGLAVLVLFPAFVLALGIERSFAKQLRL